MDCCYFKQPLDRFELSVISETHLNVKSTVIFKMLSCVGSVYMA